MPDGNQNIVYSNYAGQTMLKVFQSGSNQRCDFYQYDGLAQTVLYANPSAVAGYSEGVADLLGYNSSTGLYSNLKNNTGLIETLSYHACSGYVTAVNLQKGQLGTSIKQRARGQEKGTQLIDLFGSGF